MELIPKIENLLEKYKSWEVDLEQRLKELSDKDQWDIYADREIHLRYVKSTIEDVSSLLKAEND